MLLTTLPVLITFFSSLLLDGLTSLKRTHSQNKFGANELTLGIGTYCCSTQGVNISSCERLLVI